MRLHPLYASRESSRFQPAPRRRLRVVVAGDDRDTVLSLSALLEEEGFETMGVYNGHDAVAAVSSFGADAALIDGAKPLLIAVTAWAKAADRLMARVAGFDHHVGKPYDPNELLMLLGPLKESDPS